MNPHANANKTSLSAAALRRAAALGLLGALLGPQSATAQLGPPPDPAQARVVYPITQGEAAGIQARNGDASPADAVSNINNYVNQEDQINLKADDGDVRVLRTDQKALLNEYVTRLYPVRNANARELRNVMRAIVGLEGGAAEVIKDKASGEQFLQVICPTFMLPYLERSIPALDEKWTQEKNNGSASVYYRAKNRRAADVDVIASQYASENGFSVVDVNANAVSRADEPIRIEHYQKAAAEVDIPANQVLLEVTMYELSTNDDSKIGLDYINWKNGPGRNLFQFVWNGAKASSRNDLSTSVFDPFRDPGDLADAVGSVTLRNNYDQLYRSVNFLLTSNFLDFLQVKGKARVITRETQVVKSANTATFSAEDQVVALVSSPGDASQVAPDTLPGIGPSLVATRNIDGSVTASPAAVRDSTRRLHERPAGSTGIFVVFTPFVGLESMELVVSASYADLNGIAPNGQPIINSRNVQTTARLVNGEPYVISGLKRIHKINDSAKAPFLGDIPGLGYLFGGKTSICRTNDVLIVVKPTFILSGQKDETSPVVVENIDKIVSGAAPLPEQHASVGYDQWVLDKNK